MNPDSNRTTGFQAQTHGRLLACRVMVYKTRIDHRHRICLLTPGSRKPDIIVSVPVYLQLSTFLPADKEPIHNVQTHIRGP